MNSKNLEVAANGTVAAETYNDAAGIGLADLLTWVGEGKRLIAAITGVVGGAAIAYTLLVAPTFTAHATYLAPGSQQQAGSSAAAAALGALGGLGASFGSKSPDELYVSLLKSDSVSRALIDRFDLKTRYGTETYESAIQTLPNYIRISSDKKSGLISVEVDDRDPKFAADLANAHSGEVSKVLGRLAVSEAQLRRVFYEKQLAETKEKLIAAEQSLRKVQESSGVILLDKQAEALISGAAQVRTMIADREVRLRVLRTGATTQNPDVIRLNSELNALRSELARMESSQSNSAGSTVDMPVGKIPEASVEYVRARRELKLQETLLDGMIRQYELAKLDEAKEGPALQPVDVALPPDKRSKPKRVLIVSGAIALSLMLSVMWVISRKYIKFVSEDAPDTSPKWLGLRRAWRFR